MLGSCSIFLLCVLICASLKSSRSLTIEQQFYVFGYFFFPLKLLCDYSLYSVTIKKTKGHGKNSIKMAVFQTPSVTGTE